MINNIAIAAKICFNFIFFLEKNTTNAANGNKNNDDRCRCSNAAAEKASNIIYLESFFRCNLNSEIINNKTKTGRKLGVTISLKCTTAHGAVENNNAAIMPIFFVK